MIIMTIGSFPRAQFPQPSSIDGGNRWEMSFIDVCFLSHRCCVCKKTLGSETLTGLACTSDLSWSYRGLNSPLSFSLMCFRLPHDLTETLTALSLSWVSDLPWSYRGLNSPLVCFRLPMILLWPTPSFWFLFGLLHLSPIKHLLKFSSWFGQTRTCHFI